MLGDSFQDPQKKKSIKIIIIVTSQQRRAEGLSYIIMAWAIWMGRNLKKI